MALKNQESPAKTGDLIGSSGYEVCRILNISLIVVVASSSCLQAEFEERPVSIISVTIINMRLPNQVNVN